MEKYLGKVRSHLVHFQAYEISQIPRSQNSNADALAKLASAYETDLMISVPVEILDKPSILEPEMMEVDSQPPSWMDSIRNFLEGNILVDPREAKKMTRKAARYFLRDETMYRRGFSLHLPKCIQKKMRIMSSGKCMKGSVAITREPALCEFIYQPLELLTPISAPWPFAQWGVDLIRPFLLGKGQTKYVIVAVGYFTKWAEAEALSTITEARVTTFIWTNVVCRFGIPNAIVTDNGKQFDNAKFKDFCHKLGISHLCSSLAHPKANWEVEAFKKIIKRGLKLRLDARKGRWIEELPEVLWSYRTTPRTGETPFTMAFGSEAMVPVEIGMPTERIDYYEHVRNEEELLLNLDLLDEKREVAQLRLTEYQNRITRHYNSVVRPRSFQVGHLVLRKVQKHVNTLEPSWEGSFEVKGIV
ncbi:protein NYNRIN-like [Momordica charantia]|uniref:Protein NYNRIN-like n=1 Tax=Momordica charantia TaxID=3673 RepID=A0A6J1CLW5_MOMCH|nr:protein NYNRIN-like [Momordica charantia]